MAPAVFLPAPPRRWPLAKASLQYGERLLRVAHLANRRHSGTRQPLWSCVAHVYTLSPTRVRDRRRPRMALRMESKLGRLFRPLAKQARYMHAAKAAVGTRSGRRCTKCKEELSQCSILALRAGTSYRYERCGRSPRMADTCLCQPAGERRPANSASYGMPSG